MSESDPLVDYGKAASVSDAIRSRRSLRAFLPTPIARQTLESILATAARAPSGTNMQPWHTLVVEGERRQRLCEAVCAAYDDPAVSAESSVRYYPENWFSPFIERRRKVGWDLYGLLGIAKGDKAAMHAQHRRNFEFFDAPTGLIFTIHRDLATGSWLDYGLFLQNIMLLAREAGLHTCPQAAWADYHATIREVLPIPESHHVVCGMAIGHADSDARVNELLTEREPLSESVQFFD